MRERKRFWWIFLGLLVLAVLLPNSPLFRQSVGEDSGAFLYLGQQILEGRIPYRDAWDHKGPVIFYINALGLLIGHGSRWGVWAFEYLSVFLSVIIGFLLVKKTFGFFAAVFSSVLWLVSLILVLEGGNLTEEYNLLPQFLLLYLFWRAETSKNYGLKGFLIGVIGSVSFLLRQNLAGLFISVILFLVIRGVFRKRDANLLRDLGLIFGGFLLPLIFVFYYFMFNHAFIPMLDGYFRFNFFYSSSSFFAHLKTIFMGWWILARSGLTFITLSAWILGLICFRLVKNRFSCLLPLALIGLPVEWLLVSVSGAHPPHYFMSLLPVSSLLVSFFACLLSEGTGQKAIPAKSIITPNIFLSVLLISLVGLPLGLLFYEYRPEQNARICRDLGWFLLPSSQYFECTETKIKAGEYARLNTKKDDYVLMWGFGASINFFAERRSPSRFFYQYPLFLRGYTGKELASEFVNNAINHKPQLIIDTTSSTSGVPPLDAFSRTSWKEGLILPQMNQWFSFVDNNYKFIGFLGEDKWRLYRSLDK